jgi:arginyl-tRNA synthetase
MVIDLLEKAEQVPESDRMIGRVKHIPFGWVKFEGQMMSTRAGNIVILEDVIDRAIDLAKDIIHEKNPDLENIDETAQMIGVGAVIFSQLSVRRNTDVNFIWEEVLNFDGETGPYLQYTHARLNSLLRNYPGEITKDADFTWLDRPEEHRVIDLLSDFPQAILDAARQYEPHVIAHYLLSLAGSFNAVYQRRDDSGRTDKIIAEEHPDRSAARIALVKCVQTVLAEGLHLLGLKAPERM